MKSLSILTDAAPAFDRPIPVGQLYFPSWERYEAAMRGIFEREYYNNNGPLLSELEAQLRVFFGTKHAICVGNATFGLMMVAEALGLKGRVILPSFTYISSAVSVAWSGAKPLFCDVEPDTHQIDPNRIEDLLAHNSDISAIMAVNLWGDAADIPALQDLSDRYDVPLFFDSAHAAGCAFGARPIGGFGRAEVFSFHATKALGAAEGGCITTDGDALAARLRGIRPSYGSEPSSEPYRVINSRMSEAQAAIALMNLDDFEAIRARNKRLFTAYAEGLSGIEGLRVLHPTRVSKSNYQYAVCDVNAERFGVSRDLLMAALQAENVQARRYFYPGIHRSAEFGTDPNPATPPLPVTETLCAECLQLPLGAKTDEDTVELICALIAEVQRRSAELGQDQRCSVG
ncbi:MAG: DegT/DnrJ/EryC1/StrS family aminotransferase [Pseudomonadota bacterium]